MVIERIFETFGLYVSQEELQYISDSLYLLRTTILQDLQEPEDAVTFYTDDEIEIIKKMHVATQEILGSPEKRSVEC